jgi:Fic family protein
LLQSVRGEHKLPGEFRKSQNWIGGASLSDAVFIPPQHQMVNSLMGDLESFLNNDQIDVPALIRIAIAHSQFETIHPFLDGNGRVGRLMITLYLVNEGILEKPLLYLSQYFENNKDLYYDNLTRVRTQNNILQWIKYFLVGVEQSATDAVVTLSTVIQLKDDLESQINSSFGRRSNSALILLNALFQNPVTTIDNAAKKCSLSYKAANDLVRLMQEKKMVEEMTGQSRNRIFIFKPYLDIFSD